MQAEKKQREIEIIELYNTTFLNNLLPNHVISHFLNPDITAVISSCGNLRLYVSVCMCLSKFLIVSFTLEHYVAIWSM